MRIIGNMQNHGQVEDSRLLHLSIREKKLVSWTEVSAAPGTSFGANLLAEWGHCSVGGY